MKQEVSRIKNWLFDKLGGIEAWKINFDLKENQEVISNIKKRLFGSEELQNQGASPFSILVKRSLAQFWGWKYWTSAKWRDYTRNFISLVSFPFFVCDFFLRWLINSHHPGDDKTEAATVVFSGADYCREFLNDIFNSGYKLVYGKYKELKPRDLYFLLKIIGSCPRYLLYPELVTRTLLRLAQYSAVINRDHPQKIINFSEGSCWSSVLTAYCRERRVNHVNIMHGLRYFSSLMAFPEFDRFYVWGEYHLDHFKKMDVSAREFIIFGNPIHRRLRREISDSRSSPNKRLLIMFEIILLSDERYFQLLGDLIHQMPEDYEIACRYHPLEIQRSKTFVNLLAHVLQKNVFSENPKALSLAQSIQGAELVVGCYTNALTDAWIAGRKCIYLHLAEDNKIPLQEFHNSKSIKIFRPGDSIKGFLDARFMDDEEEVHLKNRFSKGFNIKGKFAFEVK